MNVVSIIIGVVALLLALVAFIPPLGLGNLLVIPIAVVGLIVGLLSDRNSGRNVNAVVLVFSAVRLVLGGGF